MWISIALSRFLLSCLVDISVTGYMMLVDCLASWCFTIAILYISRNFIAWKAQKPKDLEIGLELVTCSARHSKEDLLLVDL